jgi:hypothetical protein
VSIRFEGSPSRGADPRLRLAPPIRGLDAGAPIGLGTTSPVDSTARDLMPRSTPTTRPSVRWAGSGQTGTAALEPRERDLASGPPFPTAMSTRFIARPARSRRDRSRAAPQSLPASSADATATDHTRMTCCCIFPPTVNNHPGRTAAARYAFMTHRPAQWGSGRCGGFGVSAERD